MMLMLIQSSSPQPRVLSGHTSKVCRVASVRPFYLSMRLVQKSSKSISLPDILSSLSPTSLSDHLTALRRDITANFIEFALTQPLSIPPPTLRCLPSPNPCQSPSRSMDASFEPLEHRLELFPAPPNSATLVSRLDNLSGILEFLNTHLFGAIPSSHRAAFLKSLSKPLTSGILNRLLIPALPTSLSGLPKYLELLERAIKFENEDLSRLLSGVSTGTENEIKSWVDGIVSHYQKERRVGILDQARRMFTDVSSDWHGTFQVEWTLAPATQVEPPPVVDHPPGSTTNGANGVGLGVEIDQVDDEGWGFGNDDREEDAQPNGETNESQRKNLPPALTDPNVHEVDNDAWGWNDDEDLEPTPVPVLGSSSETKENENGNARGDDPLWDAWDDPPPSPPTKKTVPKPATKLEKLSNKSKQSAKPPNIVTQPPEPEQAPIRVNPNHFPAPASSVSLSSSWTSSSGSPESQQFQSIPPTPASITMQPKAPKEYYSVSSGMQDILELVESVMLEASEFSRSTLLAAYLPAPDSGSSTSSGSGGTPGSVILNTVPSILDLFRALYPMALRLEHETAGGSGKSVATEGSTKKAIQFSNDCLYLAERIRELLPASPPRSGNTPSTIPPDVWRIDTGIRGKVEDAGKRVKAYGESWFARTVVRHLSPPLSVCRSP